MLDVVDPAMTSAAQQTPFAALTLIVAPAVLTNASSVLSLTTANRLARAADRIRDLMLLLEAEPDDSSPFVGAMTRELKAAQRRMFLLVRALRYFYIAIGSFASAALTSLIGAIFTLRVGSSIGLALEILAIAAGFVAVGGLVHGIVLLVRETRVAHQAIKERVAQIEYKFSERFAEPDPENDR